jgi:osmotically-inducible protein OsmY
MRRDLIILTATGVGGAAALWLRRRRRVATPPAPPAAAEGVLERTGPLGDPRGDGLAPAPDDAVLTDRVRSALGHHPLGAHVNVNVEFGTVVLRGEVPGDDDIVDLGAAAEAVDGVARVDNRLHRHGARPPLEDRTG